MHPSSLLFTDLYQLTMAHAAWHQRRHDQHVCFHLFFRTPPFDGGYALCAGLDAALSFLENLRLSEEEADYLATLTGADDQPLFHPEFLDLLRDLRFQCDVDAIPEGTPVFPHEPLLRVTGPLWHAQLVETPLLNLINFETLIATKAARISRAAAGQPVLEFGLRRAQGPNGAMTAARAAYLGGCAATSNVLAGMRFGIPVKGTHAHSWVMLHDDEQAAFDAYADAMPNNSILLVDTYDTLEGVRRAIRTGHRLREQGHDLGGIRLDSGDLAWLSQQARLLLDDAGFPNAKIVASNDLDEELIESLHHQNAAIDIWGVGTKLISAYGQPALGGVYKLGAIRKENGDWEPRIKLSEQSIKTTNPGRLQVRRFFDNERALADAIWNIDLGFDPQRPVHDPVEPMRSKPMPENLKHQDLLVPVMRQGKRIAPSPSLQILRERAQLQLDSLDPSCRRLKNPHRYPAGVEARLWDLRQSLTKKKTQGDSP